MRGLFRVQLMQAPSLSISSLPARRQLKSSVNTSARPRGRVNSFEVSWIEWLAYSKTHRVYGQFRDPSGNLIEFEVITNQPGGVGGMWFNNARHREVHIELVFEVIVVERAEVACAASGKSGRFSGARLVRGQRAGLRL